MSGRKPSAGPMGTWPMRVPWQGRFSQLKCNNPNVLTIRVDERGVDLFFEMVDPRDCRDGWRPCQMHYSGAFSTVSTGVAIAEAFKELGKMVGAYYDKGVRFVPPEEESHEGR